MAEVGDAQDFIAQLDETTLSMDAMFSILKKPDIVATLEAATTGKYSDYWSLDKLVDLNNAVDATPGVPESMKDIFKGSKNPRLRANKVGALILSHTLELKNSGFPGDSASLLGQPAMNPPPMAVSPSRPMSQAGAVQSGGFAQEADEPAPASMMQRYVFAADMPDDAALNIRARPTMDAEVIDRVQRDQDILCVGMQGDWLRVELPGSGIQGQAWMLREANGRTLVVPAPESPLRPQRSVSQRVPMEPVAASMPNFDPMQSMSYHDLDPLSNSQGAMRPSTRGTDHLSASLNPARSSAFAQSILGTVPAVDTSSSVTPTTVSYAAYQMLEMRVSRLEQELASLIHKLHSI